MALEALRGERTLQEIASQYQVHPNQVGAWKRQAVESLAEEFSKGAERRSRDHESEIRDLHAKIGELIMDWASRYVFGWRMSNKLDAGFCTGALKEALARYGAPEIFNTHQGSQFTSMAVQTPFTVRLVSPPSYPTAPSMTLPIRVSF